MLALNGHNRALGTLQALRHPRRRQLVLGGGGAAAQAAAGGRTAVCLNAVEVWVLAV